MPPEFQTVTETKTEELQTPLAQVPPPTDGSASPPPPEVTSLVTPSKKKYGTGKIIATILGILILVGGVGAGIALTSQKQLFQQKAEEPTPAPTTEPERVLISSIKEKDIIGSSAYSFMTSKYKYSWVKPNDANYIEVNVYWKWEGRRCQNQSNEKHEVVTPLGTVQCKDYGNEELVDGLKVSCPTSDTTIYYGEKILCGTLKGEFTGETFDVKVNFTGDDSTPGSHMSVVTGDWYGVAAPNYTAPSCFNVKVYNNTTDWTLLSDDDLAILKGGDVVVFAANGEGSTNGSLGKAQFIVIALDANDNNLGEISPEITNKRSGTNEFYWEYTIPEGVSGIDVEAKLFDSNYGWF